MPSVATEEFILAAKSATECHRWALAEEYANRVLAREPRHFDALAIKGMIYTNWQCHDRAVLFWENLVKQNPTDPFIRKSYERARGDSRKGLKEKNLSIETLYHLHLPFEEKRQWERRPCRWELVIQSLREDRRMKISLSVVSAGGGRIEGPVSEVPKKFHFLILLPTGGTVSGIAERVEGSQPNACGVKFSLMTPEDRELLNHTVLNLPESPR